MRYTFQQSKIWESGNPVDPQSTPVTVKVPARKGEAGARRLLPSPETGRVWILIHPTAQTRQLSTPTSR